MYKRERNSAVWTKLDIVAHRNSLMSCRCACWWYRALCGGGNKSAAAIQYADTVEFVPPIHRGIVVKVYDGDTITVASRLDTESRWFTAKSTLYRFRVRLRGIDTPEIKGSSEAEKTKAKEARDALSAQIMGQEVVLRNLGNEKYGRVLADVYFREVHMNQWMLEQGYAQVYDGGTKSCGFQKSEGSNIL